MTTMHDMPDWRLSLQSAPAEEPVSLEEAKLHLRVDHDDEDTLINADIAAARRYCEQTVLSRALITQTWDLYMDKWPDGDELLIPQPPLQSVDEVAYTDEDGTEFTFDAVNYIVDTASEPGRIALKSTASWPSVTLQVVNGVRVRFTAGYGDAAGDVPETIRKAMKLLIGDLYEHREESLVVQGLQLQRLPFGVRMLLEDERMRP